MDHVATEFRLFGDGIKNLCADESPVARVFRRGALSPPQEAIRAGQGPGRRTRPMSRFPQLRRGQLPFRVPELASAIPTIEGYFPLAIPLCGTVGAVSPRFPVGSSTWNGISPLECTVTKKCACKSFRIHSYKIIGLKLPWNDTLTKIRGGCPPPLPPLFCCQLSTASRGHNVQKTPAR